MRIRMNVMRVRCPRMKVMIKVGQHGSTGYRNCCKDFRTQQQDSSQSKLGAIMRHFNSGMTVESYQHRDPHKLASPKPLTRTLNRRFASSKHLVRSRSLQETGEIGGVPFWVSLE